MNRRCNAWTIGATTNRARRGAIQELLFRDISHLAETIVPSRSNLVRGNS
ncbi:hypothetical protein THTE_0384 [Thermogutta terrifontis]|uniref:Uncharacterized protein n=1 Tax=Thermogutta terrifontis TaxID=1331910 RepID=A0A286RAJ6_9BACT|nr:hypothetical protein THTE_0384 [Thermogutta terrifontis]